MPWETKKIHLIHFIAIFTLFIDLAPNPQYLQVIPIFIAHPGIFFLLKSLWNRPNLTKPLLSPEGKQKELFIFRLYYSVL